MADFRDFLVGIVERGGGGGGRKRPIPRGVSKEAKIVVCSLANAPDRCFFCNHFKFCLSFSLITPRPVCYRMMDNWREQDYKEGAV